jgi:hypothetical protein
VVAIGTNKTQSANVSRIDFDNDGSRMDSSVDSYSGETAVGRPIGEVVHDAYAVKERCYTFRSTPRVGVTTRARTCSQETCFQEHTTASTQS